jgi:hypothetical protein
MVEALPKTVPPKKSETNARPQTSPVLHQRAHDVHAATTGPINQKNA